LVELHYLEHPDGALRLGCVKATSGGGDLDTIGEVTWGAEPNSDRARMVQLPQVLSTQLASAWNSFHEVSGGLSGILTQPGPLSPLLSVISDRWRSRVYKFDVHRQGTQRQRGISSHNALAPSGENLPEVLLDMKTNDERRFDEVASIVADVVPEVGRLVARTNAAHVWVEFEDVVSGRRTNLVDVGTGVQQILLAAVIGCTADRHSLVLLEEPELHLHPGAQRKLLSHLQRWSENVCLLASTHSTIFLDAVAEAGDVWSVERKDGDTTLHNASTTMPDVLENLGVRPADVLGADGLLIVEGPSDRAIMECWMPDLRARNISVQVAGGGDGARQADNLADWFSGLDTLVRPVVFLRDRDELGQHDVDKLQETGRVVVLDRREIENFLLDVDVLSSYLKSRGVAGAEASQISEIIDIACDDLRAVVHLKRVAAQLGPIRLLDRKTVAKIAESSPTRAAVLEVVAQNLPSVTALADVGALWDSESKALADCWSDQRRILAAGSDILELIRPGCGGGFVFRKG